MQARYAEEVEAQVWQSLDGGDVQEAIASCERLNREFPNYASGWHTASQLAFKLGNTAMALDAIREALRMDPDRVAWQLQLAQCLWKLGRVEQLRMLLRQLQEIELDTAYECSKLGLLLTHLDERAEAVPYYQRATELDPDDARHFYNLASLQRTLGSLEAAEANFDKAISLNPDDHEAWKLRSELRTQTPESNHVAALEELLSKGADDARGEANICYALAKELEDLGKTDKSFAYLVRGANARRSQMQYDLDRDLATMSAIQKSYGQAFAAKHHQGRDSNQPIFVLGMPRTGTTLVERILASHSDVVSAGELTNFAAQMMRMLQVKGATPAMSRDEHVGLSASLNFAELGRAYIESTHSKVGAARRFVDKMPLNYLYVGLLTTALPNAKIVHVQRDPLDTIYAVYKTLFVDAYPFSYNLEELATYYVAYNKLMRHWADVFPNAMYSIRYEELVANPEDEARRLVEACGLSWQSSCLEFHKSREASTTASSVQVRQPIYQSSVGRWRDYESQLQPAVEILSAAGIVE